MRQLLLCITTVICLFLGCSGCGQDPVSTGDEVSTGSIFGKILTDGEPSEDTVNVFLYKSSAKKESIPVDSLKVFDGRYTFEELEKGTYRIEVVREEIIVGEKKDVTLDHNDDMAEVNIEITIIINQTFNIEIEEKNITINNFFIENGKVEKRDSGYVVTCVEMDTVVFKVELLQDDDTVVITVKGIRDENKEMTFEVVENPVELTVVTVKNRSTGEIALPVEKPGEITIESPFDTSGAPEEGK